MSSDEMLDCAIVGGGAAGLSAALVLGRARRTAVVFDAGEQNNLVAPHVGGLFGHDATRPGDLYRLAREQLAPFPTISSRDVTVASITALDDGFVLDAGGEVRARRVLVATGIRYDVPEIAGMSPLWGDTVFHCPFCHGWEMRDRRLAVLGEGAELAERAILLRSWSDDVVALTGGSPFDETEVLERAGITLVDRRIVDLRTDADADGGARPRLAAIAFDDGTVLERDGLLVKPVLSQRAPFADQLGLELSDRGTIHVDHHGRTSVPGVFAAGDVAGETQQVIVAAAAGASAAYRIVHEAAGDAFARA